MSSSPHPADAFSWRQRRSSAFTLIEILVFVLGAAVLPGVAFAAGSLGEHILFDAITTPASAWKTAKGITVAVEDRVLVLRSGDIDHGWATTGEQLPICPGAALDIEVGQATNGQVGVQAEWFTGSGTFLGRSDLLKEGKRGTTLTRCSLAERAPREGYPRQFALKFWIEGRDAELRITRAIVHAPLAWRKPDRRLVFAYKPDARFASDPGMSVRADAAALAATLDSAAPYSSFVLEQRVAYDPKAVLLLDLQTLHGGVLSVQALCWDRDGAFLRAVDLIKDVAEAGVVEFPFNLVTDPFPSETRQLSFKVWLSGTESRVRSARIGGLYYGVAP